MLKRYRLRDGRLVDDDGAPLNDESAPFVPNVPYVVSDIPGYRSPINGEWIEGRKARREDLKRNDCVERDPPARKRGYRNKRFCEKYGLRYEG